MNRSGAAATGGLALAAVLLWSAGRGADPALEPRADGMAPAGAVGTDVRAATQTPASGERLVAALGCAACHTGLPDSPDASDAPAADGHGPALDGGGRRRDAAGLFAYLGAAGAAAPAHRPDFKLSEAERLALALHLSTLKAATGGGARPGAGRADRAARDAFDRARSEHPAVDAALGRRVFTALNCAACHAHPEIAARRNGPDLSREAARVRPQWLARWLAEPTAVRPFGHVPGDGGRMPDFGLTAEQADSIAAYLLGPGAGVRPGPGGGRAPGAAPARPLSAFRKAKAEALLRDRLPCLGCHRLDGEGGRIGPDLSAAGRRLRPAFVRAIVEDPRRAVPGTVMPRTPLDPETRELVVAYLLQREAGPTDGGYLSPIGDPVRAPEAGRAAPGRRADPDGAGARALYGRYCAACHGVRGEGDGFNARHMGAAPTAHAAAAYMARRPDDTLFDGIFAGGRILNRSHRMPAFGQTLTRAQIRGLVRYLRELCSCEGPAWSLDGRRGG